MKDQMSDALLVTGLHKNYGDHAVLKGVDFSVRRGEIFALLGSNGAGKTTTLECIEGLRRYDRGTITVNGRTGIQLQSASLPEHIRAMEAVRLFAGWNRTSADETMLSSLGIGELSGKQYYQLSTGQKRRLHLALALIRDPDILFLDEPTAGLDVEARISLHRQIRRLKEQGKTIILASHDMAEVETLCDRIAILAGGKIAFIGTVPELNEQVGRHYKITVRVERPGQTLSEYREELFPENGTETYETYESDDIAETLLSLLGQYKKDGTVISDIRVDRGSLEQHFMKIAKENNR